MIGLEVFVPQLKNQIFETCGFYRKFDHNKHVHIQVQNSTCEFFRFLSKTPKTSFLGHFQGFWDPTDQYTIIFKIWTSSIFLSFDPISTCKKSGKTDELLLRFYVANKRKDRQTEPDS